MNRREFLQWPLAAALAGPIHAADVAPNSNSDRFTFVLLGDLHLDRWEHHNLAWVEKNKPNDIRQIKNYSRITAEIMPQLLASVKETIAEQRALAKSPVQCVIQVGDFVEGLCGSLELATRHNQDAIQFIEQAKLGVPFLFTKGNHDITGDGAGEAYQNIFHPFLTAQSRRLSPPTGALTHGSYTVETGPVQFAFFDAYDRESLDWLEAVAARRTARHLFVVIHPPVIPYGARSTWHLYARANDKARREKLLQILGQQNALVLGGHIHKYNLSTRRTDGGGRFLQLALSSIIDGPNVTPRDELNGLAQYTPDQIRVEPNFSPDNEPERREIYEREREFVSHFEYANLPGYAVVNVNGADVEATIYSGISRKIWRQRHLTKVLNAA